jgi:hypothetical protein
MSELHRLDDGDPTVAALLGAARAYRPPARVRRGILRALGIPLGLSLVGSLAHAAQLLAPWKGWLAAGALVTASAGGGALYLSQRVAAPAPRPAVEHVAVPTTRPRAPAPVSLAIAPPAPPAPIIAPPDESDPFRARTRTRTRTRESLRIVSEPEHEHEHEHEHEIGPEPTPVAPPPLIPSGPAPLPRPMLIPAPAPAAPAAIAPGLEAELALVEKARRQLALGSAADALATLDDHARAFPHGALDEEAEILRLSALAAAGSRPEAAARARSFLLAHPRSPLAARARSFLLAPPSPAAP